jgi:hypothetical protein
MDEEIETLDRKLGQLKREFEQYFLGSRPREPVLLKAEVYKKVAFLSQQPIQNTALRFRFSSLCSRYQSMRRQWEEILRKIEAGTYERHQFKAQLHERERRVEDPRRRRLVPPAEEQQIGVVDAELAEPALERPAHQRGDARVALHHDGDVVTVASCHAAHSLAEWLRAQAPPVEAAQAEIVRALDLARGERPTAGGEPERRDTEPGAPERTMGEGHGIES